MVPTVPTRLVGRLLANAGNDKFLAVRERPTSYAQRADAKPTKKEAAPAGGLLVNDLYVAGV
jgi:hypothetical protein